jgi:hypothetical protein
MVAAFAQDPTGKKRKLIPVRVTECALTGMLAPIIYIDLIGLGEPDAKRALLDGLKPSGRPVQPQPFPGKRIQSDISSAPFPPSGLGAQEDSPLQIRLRALKNLDERIQEYEAINERIIYEVNPVTKLRLERQLRSAKAEIERLEGSIENLEPSKQEQANEGAEEAGKRKQEEKVSRKLLAFLCHSSHDKIAVRDLYGRLIRDGFSAWLDEEDLIPGQAWDTEIRKAVRASDVVIVCLSRSSITKEGYVQKEIRYALDVAQEKPPGTIFLIPTRLDECNVPDCLKDVHWVDLFKEQGYEKLLKALRKRGEVLGVVAGDPQSSAAPNSECETASVAVQQSSPHPSAESATVNHLALSIPEGWTFEQAVRAIVKAARGIAHFEGFQQRQLATKLPATDIDAPTPRDALAQLRYQCDQLPDYRVELENNVYHIRA